MPHIAAAAKAAGKRWGVAAGNSKYRNEALSLGPAFATSADDLTALQTGFRQLLDRRDPV
jgi:2-keto-3-deoxy-L-rhamnonate aldolase RhmA